MTRDWIQERLAESLQERYEILRWLGGGGMAQVFLARNRVLGALFAVKVLDLNLAEDERIVERFLEEARTAVTLAGHPNIVPVFDVCAENGLYFFIMQYVEGEDLAKYLRQKQKLSPDEATKVVLEVADALSWASAKGVVHRDLKPSNLYLNQAGHVMVLDFGIAKAADNGSALTRPNEKWGTPEYMSPEQKRGDNCDTRSDLYSLGIVFLELLTGTNPFRRSSETSAKNANLHKHLPDLTALDSAIPPKLSSVLVKLLAEDVNARYQSPKELIEDLKSSPSPPPTPPPPAPPNWRKWAWIAASAVLVAIAVWLVIPPPPIPASITDKLGGRMLLVSAGIFTFGGDDPESPNERQSLALPSFYIDAAEVSNRDYIKFCKETGHKLPPSETKDDQPDFPVTNVSFEDAEQYAKWIGKRVPNEKEWEKAARGTDGRVFPWGNETWTNPPTAVQAIFSCPNRLSPYGAYNMAGNVAEWTTSHFPAGKAEMDDMTKVLGTINFSHNWRVIKGGYFGSGPDVQQFWKTYMRRGFPEDLNVSPVIGFRCVQDAPRGRLLSLGRD